MPVLGVALFAMVEQPPQAPSATARMQRTLRERARAEHQKSGDSAGWSSLQESIKEVGELLRNPNFVLLCGGFAVGTGTIWAVLILEQQLISPCGCATQPSPTQPRPRGAEPAMSSSAAPRRRYSDAFAGALGAALLGAGVVAAFAVAFVMESTKAYLPLQKADSVLALVAMCCIFLAARPDNGAALFAAWVFLGVAVQPMMPITLEHAAEITYPVGADSSTALVFVCANTFGTLLVLAVTPLLALPRSADCSSVWTPAAGLVCSLMAVGTALMLSIGQDYRRQAAEKGVLKSGSGRLLQADDEEASPKYGAVLVGPAGGAAPQPSGPTQRITAANSGAARGAAAGASS